MRIACLLSAALAISAASCTPEAPPPEPPAPKAPAPKPPAVVVRSADTLAPDDIGVGKYLFEASPPVGKVMVLRCTETSAGRKQDDVLESIQSSNGEAARQVVLVYDPSQFPFGDRKTGTVRIKAQAGSRSYSDRRCTSTSISPGRLTLEFTDPTRPAITLTYDCFIEDYAKAKARVPKLPAQSPIETWTYNASFPRE